MQAKSRPDDGLSPPAFAIVCGVSAVAALGNTGMISVLPTIGREIGIPDPLVAAIFSLSAVLWAITSPIWARASDRHGRKPLMMLGLVGFAVSMAACSVVVSAGLHGLAPPMTIFVLFLLARSVFGLIGSASSPASQVYVAERTGVEERTQRLSTLAGAFGLGTVLGPFLAPLFILPILGLAGPMATFALLGVAMLVLVWRRLPETRSAHPAHADDAAASAEKPPPIWKDGVARPFIIYAFLTAACQNGLGQTLGFLIIDRLALKPAAAQGFIAIAMMFGAVAALLAQWGLVRMFAMTARGLLRWGVAIAAAGSLMMATASAYWVVVAGFAVACMGFAFARPGAAAGLSLAVEMRDQGRAAGAIAAVNGASVMLAPGFVALYGLSHPSPMLVVGAILAGLLIYAYAAKSLRNAAPTPATGAEALEHPDQDGGAP